MKKLITAVVLVATMFVAGKVQAQFSVNFGLSHNFITERISSGGSPTGDGPSISINSLHSAGYNGLSLGANYNFRLSEEFGISVGGQFRWDHLHLSKSILGPMPHRYISNVYYVDVPVMLNYSCKISDNWKVGPFIGPMLTYGLGGTIKICSIYHSNVEVHPWYGEYGDSHFSKHAGQLFTVMCIHLASVGHDKKAFRLLRHLPDLFCKSFLPFHLLRRYGDCIPTHAVPVLFLVISRIPSFVHP